MKALFLSLFLLPLFASAQTTTDQDRYGKIELMWSYVGGYPGPMSQATVMLTNLSKETLTFNVGDSPNSDGYGSILLGPGEMWQLTVSPWWGDSMTVTMIRSRNNKPTSKTPLRIDVPENYGL